MKTRLKNKLKSITTSLLKLNNSPSEIALGVAIGVFIAILPLYGFHTLLVLIAAVLIRPANKIAILAGTNISLPFTLPFITWAAYEIGRRAAGGGRPAHFYKLLFLGSVILGLICAAVFYFLTYFLMKNFYSRRRHGAGSRN